MPESFVTRPMPGVRVRVVDESGQVVPRGVAEAVAQRADCTRRRVGAVVFDGANRILSTGYNGAPAGRLGCLSGGLRADGVAVPGVGGLLSPPRLPTSGAARRGAAPAPTR